ncbi:alpha/beta hydrolase [Flavobacterium artemisiae]|uniref:Alpha/beta hydrolase n=1 Tax=Flavobacterium artemisiae TaxID=2126556 RepID=A0ABW4HIV1_9FLAO
MKKALFIMILLANLQFRAQSLKMISSSTKTKVMEVLKTESRVPGLKIAISHVAPKTILNDSPILLLHGSSFPSDLSFGFRMDNSSWMSNLSENGYDVYALDFLGYGNSDRYPEMKTTSSKIVGRASEVYLDVDKAVNYILAKTGKKKIYLLGHSWGGSVAALYASKMSEKVEKLVLFATITARNENSEYETVDQSFEVMTPLQRINAMKSLTPEGKKCQLEPEIFTNWAEIWKKSDPLTTDSKNSFVRYPSGPSADVQDLLHNNSYYDPKKITAKTMIIRGEWDIYPDNNDAEGLFIALENTVSIKYVVLQKGTHVMQLEKGRKDLYRETLNFLKE